VFISCRFVQYLVCRSGPFDTLMIFTTTISVISIYNTNNVVMFAYYLVVYDGCGGYNLIFYYGFVYIYFFIVGYS